MAPIDGMTPKINYNRITGIMSGLDVDSIVENLMRAERLPLDKLVQRRQIAEWKKEQYREINSKILDLRTSYFDNVRLSSNLKAMAPFKQFKTLSGDLSKVMITTTSDAIPSSHTISVLQLAQNARAESTTSSIAKADKCDFAGYNSENNTLTITLNGESHDLILTDQVDLDSFIADIQSQISQNADLSGKLFAFKGEDGKLSIKNSDSIIELSGSALDAGKIGIANGTALLGEIGNVKLADLKGFGGASEDFTYSDDNIVFSINGREISISKEKTVADLIKAVNSSTADVTMSYNSFTGRFEILSKATGSTAKIEIEDKEGTDFLAKAGLIDNVTAGIDARYKIDGVEGISSSNSFTVDGINYTLKGVTTEDVDVSITSDTESVVNNIKGFVTKYNEMLDFINKKLKEERFRGFDPLTDEQKSAMREKDIEKWEEKAKSGLIREDLLVSNFASDIRMAVSGKVSDNIYAILSTIGITTGDYSEGGKLHLNEEILREKLEEDPDKVMELFNKKVEKQDGSIDYENSGIAYKIDQVFDKYISTSYGQYGMLIERAGTDMVNTAQNQLQLQIKGFDKDMLDMAIRLDDIQERHYRKFTALEVALSKMNSQSEWLMGQLGMTGQ